MQIVGQQSFAVPLRNDLRTVVPPWLRAGVTLPRGGWYSRMLATSKQRLRGLTPEGEVAAVVNKAILETHCMVFLPF